MVLTAIDRLLVKEHSAWWSSDGNSERSKGELIRRAADYDLTKTLRAYVDLFNEELTRAG
jgi:hypothetical protein